MNDLASILDYCSAINDNPYLWLAQQQDKERQYVGYTCIFAPEEIIHAAGLIPIRLFAAYNGDNYSEKYLHSRTCEFALNLLEGFQRGIYNFLNASIFTTSCDILQAVFKNLCSHKNAPFFFMNLPSIFKNNNETHDQNTIDFLIYELQRLKSFLEERLHVTISPQAILNSIKIYHQNARLLEKLSIFRQEGLLSVDEYYTLFKIGYFIRKEEHNTLISEALKALESRCYPDFNKKKKIKILVMGFINGDVNFIRFLKNFGMTIIADDLCGFSRYTTVKLLNKTIENPFTTIASSLLQRYCPLKISNENHFSRILSIYRNTGAQGIVILIYPFCDVQSINQAWLKHQLQEADIPVISLQPSLNIDNTAQLETRLEAFMEIVNG